MNFFFSVHASGGNATSTSRTRVVLVHHRIDGTSYSFQTAAISTYSIGARRPSRPPPAAAARGVLQRAEFHPLERPGPGRGPPPQAGVLRRAEFPHFRTSASYVYTEQAYLDNNGVWQTLSWSVTEGRIDETSREFTAPSVCEPCQVSVSDGNGWGRTYGGRLGVLAFAFRGAKMTGDVNAPLVFTGPRHATWNSTHQRSCLPICLTNEVLWKGGEQGHHAFRVTDRESGRLLHGTLECTRSSFRGILL